MRPILNYRRFAPDGPDLDAVATVYLDYASGSLESAKDYIRLYSSKEDFVGLVAEHHGVVVGMCFGAKVGPGNWWFDTVSEQLPEIVDTLRAAWTLNELGVLSPHRRQGIGAGLLQRLYEYVASPRVVLSAAENNRVARAFYARLGWRELGHVAFSNSYVVYAKELSVDTGGRSKSEG